MNNRFSRSSRLIASAAALSLIATPVMARGWGRHHDDIDAGDVITGILIIGGIAAIASAASKGKKDRERDERERDRDYPQRDDYRDRDQSRGYGNDDRPTWQEGRGIDSAVNRCVGEVERGDKRVDQVENVSRDGEGWRVSGRMAGGDSFSCSISSDGRVRSSTVDGQTAAYDDAEEAQPAI